MLVQLLFANAADSWNSAAFALNNKQILRGCEGGSLKIAVRVVTSTSRACTLNLQIPSRISLECLLTGLIFYCTQVISVSDSAP